MKHRSILANHRLRCALWCGVFLVSFAASCPTVLSCDVPQYLCGLVDLKGRAIGIADRMAFQYLGDGIFSYYLEGSTENPWRLHICNRNGEDLNPSLPDGWRLYKVYVPHPNSPLVKTVNEVPANTLFVLENGKEYQLVTKTGEQLIAPRSEYIECAVVEKFYVFLDRDHFQHIGDEKTAVLAFDPVSSRRFFKQDIQTQVFKGKIVFTGGRSKSLTESVLKNNQLENRVKQVSLCLPPLPPHCFHPFTFEPKSPDGWDKNLAIVACQTIESKEVKYGIINREHKFVLPPIYAKLDFLYGDVYVAKKEKDGYCEAITHDGAPVKLLPPNTVRAFASRKLILCEQGKGATNRESVSLIDRSGRILQSVSGARAAGFMNGVAVLETNDWSFMWHEDMLSILTKDGITHKDIPASWAVPVSENELVIGRMSMDFGPINSVDKNRVYYGGPPADLKFVYKLRENNLIGMPKEEMDKLFIIPTTGGNTLTLVLDHKGQNSNQIEFRYSDNKLQAWRWINRRLDKETYGSWIEKNVLLDWRPFCRYENSPLIDWSTVKIEPKVVATRH